MSFILNRFVSSRIGNVFAFPSPLPISSLQISVTSARSFHFMKRQVTIDPEIAKMREARKRRKLVKAIKELKKFGKKPKPVEELELGAEQRKTLDERRRDKEEESEAGEEEMYRRKLVLKQYGSSRARLARADIQWIRRSVEAQQNALEILRKMSQALYGAAVEPSYDMLPMQIQGPSISAAIEGYLSPDGEYQDATKKWEQPMLEQLEKKFGVGKLIKTPAFKKKQMEKEAEKERSEGKGEVKVEPWLTGGEKREEEQRGNVS